MKLKISGSCGLWVGVRFLHSGESNRAVVFEKEIDVINWKMLVASFL